MINKTIYDKNVTILRESKRQIYLILKKKRNRLEIYFGMKDIQREYNLK